MQGQFGASPDDISWVATAYTLCLGIVVPTSAWLGEAARPAPDVT